MKKNLIKNLAKASYTKSNLDETKVGKISKLLKKEELKVYIRDLKTIESKKTVTISVPDAQGLEDMKKYFTSLYPDKKIVFEEDSTLLSGIRVVDYDNVYELSLKSFLENALHSIKQND